MPTSKPRKDANGKAVKPKPKGHTFVWNGKRYTMPIATEAINQVPNSVWMSAYLDPSDERKNMALIFAAFEAADISDDIRSALDEMPAADYVKNVVAWFETADQSGVSAGESSRSVTD